MITTEDLCWRFRQKAAGVNPHHEAMHATVRHRIQHHRPKFDSQAQTPSQDNITISVFETSTVVAIIVYTIIAWGIVKQS